MSTDNFYATLPLLDSFLDIARFEKFAPVPDDWYVLMTDVVNSTTAIEAGRYRDINLVGASSIAAVLNVAQKIELPFIFGGDGASILIPPSLLPRSSQALLALRQLAQENLGLDLRVGVVPVSTIAAERYQIRVAKFRVSTNYIQAVIAGGGLTYATSLMKNNHCDNPYQLKTSSLTFQADLSGLECRWQDIFSPGKEVISLLVLAAPNQRKKGDKIYQEVLQRIFSIYGSEEDFRPVTGKRLRLSFNLQKLRTEAKLKSQSIYPLRQFLYLSKIVLENFLGFFLMKYQVKTGEVDWQQYQREVVTCSDYKKFDDVLRMVIASHPTQTQQLTQYLEQQSQAGELIYGVHLSDRALMTCLIAERNGQQVHFIDGADGGYTLAGKDLKEKMRYKALNWQSYIKLVRLRNRTGHS